MDGEKTSKPDRPDKFYYKIGEVSRMVAVPAYVLRFWESEFPRIKPKRTPAGQRLYRNSDVEIILEIKHLLYDKKFTIRGAKHHLSNKKSARADADPHRLLKEIRSELQAIRALLAP